MRGWLHRRWRLAANRNWFAMRRCSSSPTDNSGEVVHTFVLLTGGALGDYPPRRRIAAACQGAHAARRPSPRGGHRVNRAPGFEGPARTSAPPDCCLQQRSAPATTDPDHGRRSALAPAGVYPPGCSGAISAAISRWNAQPWWSPGREARWSRAWRSTTAARCSGHWPPAELTVSSCAPSRPWAPGRFDLPGADPHRSSPIPRAGPADVGRVVAAVFAIPDEIVLDLPAEAQLRQQAMRW